TVIATSRPKAASPLPSPLRAVAPPTARAMLDKYCVGCHNERLKTANLMLDQTNLDDVGAAAETWEKVVRNLRTGAMPPSGAPRPDKSQSDALTSWLERALDQSAVANPKPGRPSLHRLNRTEYAN